MTLRLYRLLIATGLVFVFSLALAFLDGLGWLVLPQPFRLAIPIALVLSAFFGIVMLSASLGSPARMRKEMEADESARLGDEADEAETEEV